MKKVVLGFLVVFIITMAFLACEPVEEGVCTCCNDTGTCVTSKCTGKTCTLCCADCKGKCTKCQDTTQPPADNPALINDLTTFLNTKVGSGFANKIKVPAGTNFKDWKEVKNGESSIGFYIVWEKADGTKFDTYKTAWGSSVKASILNPSARIALTDSNANKKAGLVITELDEAHIFYYDIAGDLLGVGGAVLLSIPANCIVFQGYLK